MISVQIIDPPSVPIMPEPGPEPTSEVRTLTLGPLGVGIRTALSSGGDVVGGVGRDGVVRLWTSSGTEVASFRSDEATVEAAFALSSDGRVVAIVEGRELEIRDAVAGGTRLLDLDIGAPVSDATFSPDGKVLATASWTGTIALWDVVTGTILGSPLTGHTAAVRKLAFSPDGRSLATLSDDGTLRIWDSETGAALGEPLLPASRGRPIAMAYSPAGSQLAVVGEDGAVAVWDLATRRRIDGFDSGLTDPPAISIAFTPDGLAVRIAGGYEQTLQLREIDLSA